MGRRSSPVVELVELVEGVRLSLPFGPEGVLALPRFFGLRFLVCMPSFFIASGLGTP